ncbi:MAG: hypothetical protein ACJAS0_000293 [Alcanivorax borkumensis]
MEADESFLGICIQFAAVSNADGVAGGIGAGSLAILVGVAVVGDNVVVDVAGGFGGNP